jgi:ADP-heptose:LPS heptosyltransferase
LAKDNGFVKFIHSLRKTMAAAMVSYRPGAANPAVDRTQWKQQRIAMVKLDGIGDFVLATTFLQIFKNQAAGSDVTLFCRRPVGEIARQQFPAWTVFELPARRTPLKSIYFNGLTRRRLKSQQPFDLLVDLRAYRDMGDSAVASWIPAKTKIALQNAYPESQAWVKCPAEERIYDRLIPLPDYKNSSTVRDIQNHRLLAEYFFPNLPDCRSALPKLAVTQLEKERLVQRFSPRLDGPFLLVCPGAASPIREYPVKSLAAAILQVLEERAVSVVIAGGKSDTRTTLLLTEALKGATATLNLGGQLNLAEHVALISLSSAVLTMETSHAHIAGALGIPAVVITGGGHYGIFAPWAESQNFRWLVNPLPCFGCGWRCIYDRPLCIQDILPARIAGNLMEILKGGNRTRR